LRTENYAPGRLDEINTAATQRAGRGHPRSLHRATPWLALTGTPFRSDDSPIPFVNYGTHGEA